MHDVLCSVRVDEAKSNDIDKLNMKDIEDNKVNVEVVYVESEEQHILPLAVPLGTTIEEAVELSGILQLCQQIDLQQKNQVGIFGELRNLKCVVKAGDRIEIYRGLLLDPMESRRLKAKNKNKDLGANKN